MAKKILSILIVLSFFPIGCYWQPAQISRSQDIINTWSGHNIDDLMDKWGYPQQSFTETNGNRVYVYSRVVTYIPPIWTDPILNTRYLKEKPAPGTAIHVLRQIITKLLSRAVMKVMHVSDPLSLFWVKEPIIVIFSLDAKMILF